MSAIRNRVTRVTHLIAEITKAVRCICPNQPSSGQFGPNDLAKFGLLEKSTAAALVMHRQVLWLSGTDGAFRVIDLGYPVRRCPVARWLDVIQLHRHVLGQFFVFGWATK